MSLLGRLEDLSLTDIIQIVFLSRRTGVLEVIDASGRYTVLFRHGLLANASSPDAPDLGSYLVQSGEIEEKMLPALKRSEETGVPIGSAVVEMNLMTRDALGDAIRRRIASVIGPLLSSHDGEFNFILSDVIGPLDTEYDTESIFREGGVPPNRILGVADGEKIKPLRDLEESMKAGKALLRGSAALPPDVRVGPEVTSATPPASVLSPTPLAAPPVEEHPSESRAKEGSATVVPFPQRDEDPFDLDYDDVGEEESLDALLTPSQPPPAEEPPPAPEEVPAAAARRQDESQADESARPGGEGRFRIAGEKGGETVDRNVVLFERDPLVRVAARRAFSKLGFRMYQFGSMEDTRNAVADLLRENHFFVTFLELGQAEGEESGEQLRLLQMVKMKNRHLPVVVIDRDADLRRRHHLLRAGADLYLTKPSESHLQPGLVEEQLALFADELVLFGEKAFSDWEQITGNFAEGSDVGRQYYDIARKEKVKRSFSILKQLISELSNPNDISEIAQTILHLAAEYVERGVLFLVQPSEFIGIAGFGVTGEPDDLSVRARRLRVPRNLSSVLTEVADSMSVHRGKLRKSPTNVQLIASLGKTQPTEVAVMPIVHQGGTVGILYGDNAESRSAIDESGGLEIFLSQAGLAFGMAVMARAQHQKRKTET
jgi:CheY-like chemotaxis protein